MNLYFVIAGALALLGAAIHGGVGEALVVSKLQTNVLAPTRFGGPSMTKLMIRATWHITTLAFVVIGSALAVCAPAGSSEACRGVGHMAAISYAAFGALAMGLVANKGPRALVRVVRRHPAPLIFVLVAVLAWRGSGSY
jgi:hypothetical protein